MLGSIRLERFKNFRDVVVPLGAFTVLVGTNASGKSNLRDALRFLHGVGRGYSLAEIIGGKWGEGGARLWAGIRGGTREISLRGTDSFRLEARRRFDDAVSAECYAIEVLLRGLEREPVIVAEGLDNVFETKQGQTRFEAKEYIFPFDKYESDDVRDAGMDPLRPILPQIGMRGPNQFHINVSTWSRTLRNIAFLEPTGAAMREPSAPGANILGERGENLSSVLLALCGDPRRKADILEWVRQLTPIDVADFQFPQDYSGKVLVHLVERDGGLISATSASDGTLRFLAVLAALMGGSISEHDSPPGLIFLEELDAGVHPTRLHLLVDLIERQTKALGVQVVATTHAPYVLAMLHETSLANALLFYREPDGMTSVVRRILDLPHIAEAIRSRDIARLHASGWLEDSVQFDAPTKTGDGA